MNKRPKTLSARFVETASTPGRYGDGRGTWGLSLLIQKRKNGRLSKTWSQRLRIDGHPFNLGLGVYPVVTLAEARKKTLENRRTIEQGGDPREGRRHGSAPTFAEAAEKVIALRRPTWKDGGKSEAQWRASLREYAMPKLERRPLDKITTADVMAVATPIWHEKPVTANRLLQRLTVIFDWAVASGYRADNPAGTAIRRALPKRTGEKKQQEALPYADVADAVAKLRDASGVRPMVKLAFEFLVLTASRSGEVLGVRWEEIDLDAATWTIPAERMKGGVEHRIPLSESALEVLRAARQLSRVSRLVFPSARGLQMPNGTLSRPLKKLGIKAVPHGFRSSFRDWAAESGVSEPVAEAALAHKETNLVVAAYRRSDFFDRRRQLMDDWAAYLNPVGRPSGDPGQPHG